MGMPILQYYPPHVWRQGMQLYTSIENGHLVKEIDLKMYRNFGFSRTSDFTHSVKYSHV